MRNSGKPQPKSSCLKTRASSIAPDSDRTMMSGFEHVVMTPIGDAITRHQYNVDVDEVIAACHFLTGPIVHHFSTVDTQGFLPAFDTTTSFISTSLLNRWRAYFLTGLPVSLIPQQQRAPFDSWRRPALMASRRVEPRSVNATSKKSTLFI